MKARTTTKMLVLRIPIEGHGYVLIQNLLMGLFWGARFFTTGSVDTGWPIFFSCALAKRMFA